MTPQFQWLCIAGVALALVGIGLFLDYIERVEG
jgi:hypothetical protein